MTSSSIRRQSIPGVGTPEYPFSHIVMDDRYAFLSGIVAGDLAGGREVHGDIARETELVMTAIRDALKGIGLGMDRIVRVDVHMTDISRIGEMDAEYRKFFDGGHYLTRTCTETGGLAEGSNVEITVMARL